MLVKPRNKKSLDFLNLNFKTKNLKVLAKYGWLILGTFDLTNCFYFITVNILTERLVFFVIIL